MARFVFVVLATVLAISALSSVRASDPQLTTDFFVPSGVNESTVNGTFFKFTGLEDLSFPASGLSATKVFSDEFPALTGLGVSAAFLHFPPNVTNPPHTHPRGSELLFVIKGKLSVGVIDTNFKLYEADLKQGDLFVFPVGLVHFQINRDPYKNATAISSFSSSNPGILILATTLFDTGIPIDVLTLAFSVGSSTIDILEAPYQS